MLNVLERFELAGLAHNSAEYIRSHNAVHGTTNNPRDLTRAPGGSSGGSAAALAAEPTGIEAGSDIGSSIRDPAHYCGVFGHKPTWGIVPPRGHAVLGRVATTDLSVVGPIRDRGRLQYNRAD